MPDLYLGIDTSNYKTSVAVINSSGQAVFEKSEYLEVEQGSRGLRQSEAFFRHSNRLPSYIEEMAEHIDIDSIRAVGVSTRPRRVEGSYMPCFLAGINAAREIAAVLRIPLYEFSHQEGHAAAIIENGNGEESPEAAPSAGYPEKTALFHLSGGTTELLVCLPHEQGYSLEIAGGTKDISVGQLIDRAGVAMGYPFPSGSYLDDLAESYFALEGRKKSTLPRVKITDGYFNISGIETKVLRIIEGTSSDDYPQIAYSIFESIAELLAASAVYISSEYGTGKVYMAGGVSASSFIRTSVTEKIRKHKGSAPEIIFGEPKLSGDNAVGTARLALRVSRQK